MVKKIISVHSLMGIWSKFSLVFLALLASWWAYDLGLKPTHFDEGINGWFVGQIWERGFYRYNPEHFHGPLYFYLLQISEIIFGYGIESMRLLNVLFGWGSLALLFAHRQWFGQAALWALLIAVLSPAFSFYSRYAIHEPVYIFFQILFSYGFWSYWQERSRKSFVILVSAIAALICLKETWFVFLLIWILANYSVYWTRKIWPIDNSLPKEMIFDKSKKVVDAKKDFSLLPIFRGEVFSTAFVYTTLGFILFSVFLIYTGWGLDGSGIYKLLQSLLFWAQTGVGKTGHEKVWYYWVDLVSRYEIWFFLALSGGALTLGPVNKVTRVMAVFSLGNLIAYSLIPYKTPWLILNILWPATLLFGVGVERLLEIIRDSSRKWLRWSIGPAILLVFILAGYKSWYLNFMAPASAKEPYVYVQSTQAWGQFWNVLQTYTKERPVLKNEPVAIAIKQSWPLPYLFGRYTAADLRIDLVTVFQSPELLKKYSLIILDLEDEEKLGDAMKSSGYLRKQMELRDGMDPVVIFLRAKEYADMIPLIDGLKPI